MVTVKIDLKYHDKTVNKEHLSPYVLATEKYFNSCVICHNKFTPKRSLKTHKHSFQKGKLSGVIYVITTSRQKEISKLIRIQFKISSVIYVKNNFATKKPPQSHMQSVNISQQQNNMKIKKKGRSNQFIN